MEQGEPRSMAQNRLDGGFSKRNLIAAEAVLIEPAVMSRRLLRTALTEMGLRRVQELNAIPTPDAAPGAIGSADLMIIDISDHDSLGARFVSAIRHRLFRVNPFIVVIACSASPEASVVRTAIDAGADGVLLKPFSIRQVQDQVSALIERRRPFVVTASYIGPDRRATPRPEANPAPSFTVPNSLHDRVVAGMSLDQCEAAVERSWAEITRQRARQQAFQALFQIRLAMIEEAAAERARLPGLVAGLLAPIRQWDDPEVVGLAARIEAGLGPGDPPPERSALDEAGLIVVEILARLGHPSVPALLIAHADQAVQSFRARRAGEQAAAGKLVG